MMTRRDLLEWLSKEDRSRLSECDGPLLDALVADGLVEIEPAAAPSLRGYEWVRLTEAGWVALEDKP